MLNSKKTAVTSLVVTALATSANAQFFDLNEHGMAKPSGNYQSSVATIADKVEDNPVLDTSGDERGFIPEAMPQSTGFAATAETLPVAEGFDAFSAAIVTEEEAKVQTKDIKQLDYIGFLDEKFDDALWVGVSYDYAKTRFGNFKNIESIHMRNIARDMLMAKARVPSADDSWLALRLQTLLEMGNLSDVKLLLKNVTAKDLISIENDDLNKSYLQANLLNSTTEDFIKQLLQKQPKNLDYKKSLLINLYYNGKTDAAGLAFKAHADMNAEFKDTNFFKIFNAVLTEQVLDATELKDLDVFEQYLVALNSDLFAGVDYSKFTDLTLYVAITNATDLESKTTHAELLMHKYPYSYPLSTLISVYDEYKFTAQNLTAPLAAKDFSKPKLRALFYQSSKASGLNSTKALSLKNLWKSYDEDKIDNLKLLITEKTQDINVNSTVGWISIDLLKNELKQASLDARTLKTLYENIDNVYANSNIIDLQIAVEFLRKANLDAESFDSIQDYKETLNTWFDAQKITTTEQYMHVLRVLTLLDALEAPISEDIWSRLYEKSNLEAKTGSNPVWLRLISSSMQNEEKGKSLLLVLEKFANQNPSEMDPQTLANIIACLNYLNMPQTMALVGANAIVK